jgi:hypothetical protein
VKEGLFNGGPPTRLYGWLRLRSHAERRAMSLAVGAALVCWLPLALLAAAQGDLFGGAGPGPFLRDIAVHARYLIAVPLLIASTPACVATLGMLAQHFLDAGLVTEADHERFEAALSSTRKLRDTSAAEIGVIVAAYGIVAAAFYSVDLAHLPAWHLGGQSGAPSFSAAGWWHVLVSVPLLIILVLGWVWRLFLWARFLWLVSRMNLRLMPAHPDRAAGLRVVGYSVNAQVPFAVALGVIAAGMVANRVVHDAADILSYKFVVAGLAAFVMVLVIAPLLAFADKLLTAWDRGVLDYGVLANRIGREFERNWIGRVGDFVENPLHAQTTLATTNVCTLAANVYGMRFIPIDSRSVILLVAMTLLPFIPIALMVVPLNVVVKDLARFLI